MCVCKVDATKLLCSCERAKLPWSIHAAHSHSHGQTAHTSKNFATGSINMVKLCRCSSVSAETVQVGIGMRERGEEEEGSKSKQLCHVEHHY